jgi:hypothetical protein
MLHFFRACQAATDLRAKTASPASMGQRVTQDYLDCLDCPDEKVRNFYKFALGMLTLLLPISDYDNLKVLKNFVKIKIFLKIFKILKFFF